MRQTSFADFHCSLARSLEVVGDWWTPLIIRDVALGLTRFDELAENLGISRNLLASRLEDLEANGILERRQYVERPPRYRYRLARAGVELLPILMSLTAWGDRWFTPPDGPPVRFQHKTCGHVFTTTECCSECGEPVRPSDVIPLPGPGHQAALGKRGTKLVADRIHRLQAAADTMPLAPIDDQIDAAPEPEDDRLASR
jgi:DNA-binding HxlR family transcriptional regulator